jgi:hypothetical protein
MVMAFIRAGALAGLILVASGASAEAETSGLIIKGNVIKGVRNARYCEIIPIVRDRFHLVATVYNMLGADVWAAITEDSMKKPFGAITVLLNGPRYFLMDSITAKGATKAGKKIEAGGLALTERLDRSRSVRHAAPVLSRNDDRPRHPLPLQGRKSRLHARSSGRQPLRHAGLRTDRGQDPLL